MKATGFDDLKLTDKFVVLNEFARHLFSIEYYDHRIHLFSLNSEFIELYYNITTKKVEKISSATYGDLDKYLTRIFVGSLGKG